MPSTATCGSCRPAAWTKERNRKQAAVRECHEEIGQVPDTSSGSRRFYPTPGFCDEEMVFFRLSGLDDADRSGRDGRRRGHRAARRSRSRDAREMVRRGEIVDMKTVAGLALI